MSLYTGVNDKRGVSKAKQAQRVRGTDTDEYAISGGGVKHLVE